ncbi:hypothetical protein MLD38_004542 [Melastoma candidum]|uniref:Uncharacterized protein n=1 Tax=Melastoma candidum TaxID=119954 RepID=A0ACB9S5I7_9MYRT|nr:hypothetical protein MLD38_004542 [Melastoma candidum]
MASRLLFPLFLLLVSSSSLFLFPPSPPTDSPLSLTLERPSVDLKPSVFTPDLPGRSSKESLLLCERVVVSGISRLKLGSYSSAIRVTAVPSVVIPERLHGRIQVCFHRNATIGLCQCDKSEWKGIEKGLWSSTMSPYDTGYIDVKVVGEVPGSITVAIAEELQKWRLICLGVGFILLLLSPFVSGWVPFYYSSSMAIGIFLVVIIILFQGMKLLPTGRKSALYLTLYGSMLGAGSFLLHQFSMMVNSILANFGLSEDMYNPVYVFFVLGILIAGAALGYWMVRKFVISDDGGVDVDVARFVKWAIRVIAAAFILLSTLDAFLGLATLSCCWSICYLITSAIWWDGEYDASSFIWNSYPGWSKKTTPHHNRAEFLAKSSGKGFQSPGKGFQSTVKGFQQPGRGGFWTPGKGSQGNMWNRSERSNGWSDSPVQRIVSPSSSGSRGDKQHYYSVLHKTPNRKRFTKEEWEESKSQWTREAMSGLVSSPEFADWIIEHAGRIRVSSGDSSDEEELCSDSDSTDVGPVNSGSWLGLFKRLVV